MRWETRRPRWETRRPRWRVAKSVATSPPVNGRVRVEMFARRQSSSFETCARKERTRTHHRTGWYNCIIGRRVNRVNTLRWRAAQLSFAIFPSSAWFFFILRDDESRKPRLCRQTLPVNNVRRLSAANVRSSLQTASFVRWYKCVPDIYDYPLFSRPLEPVITATYTPVQSTSNFCVPSHVLERAYYRGL